MLDAIFSESRQRAMRIDAALAVLEAMTPEAFATRWGVSLENVLDEHGAAIEELTAHRKLASYARAVVTARLDVKALAVLERALDGASGKQAEEILAAVERGRELNGPLEEPQRTLILMDRQNLVVSGLDRKTVTVRSFFDVLRAAHVRSHEEVAKVKNYIDNPLSAPIVLPGW